MSSWGAKVTEHFTWKEVEGHRSNNKILDKYRGNALALAVAVLEPLRLQTGALQVNSWYRSAAVKEQVGGVPTSDHITAEAADVTPLKVSLEVAWAALLKLMESGLPVDQAILYSTHLHVSITRTVTPRQQIIYK